MSKEEIQASAVVYAKAWAAAYSKHEYDAEKHARYIAETATACYLRWLREQQGKSDALEVSS